MESSDARLAEMRIRNLRMDDLLALHLRHSEGLEYEQLMERLAIPQSIWYTLGMYKYVTRSLIQRIHFFPDDCVTKVALFAITADMSNYVEFTDSAIVLAYTLDPFITPCVRTRLEKTVKHCVTVNNDWKKDGIERSDEIKMIWLCWVLGYKSGCYELLDSVFREGDGKELIRLLLVIRNRRWVLGPSGRRFFWQHLWQSYFDKVMKYTEPWREGHRVSSFRLKNEWYTTKNRLSPWNVVRYRFLTLKPVLVALQFRAAERVYAPDGAGTAVVAAEFDREAKKMRLK